MLNGQVSGNMTWTIAPKNIELIYCSYIFSLSKHQLLERHPFSGRCDSAGELLHTPYADSNFHGHRPAVGTTRNTLSVYRKVGADTVKPGLSWERQVESLIASSAYQTWPTTNPWYNKHLRFMCKVLKNLSKIFIRTDLKFERRPRSFKQDPQIPRLIALP
jgi:hypothetical protein